METKIYHPEKSVILDCEIGKGGTIHAPVWIGNNVKIGYFTKIQAFCFIPDGVEIGDHCFIGPGVTFTNDKNPPSSKESWEKTIVSDSVSIGANATILPGITIGLGAKIGAGSVVTKDVPEYTTVIGNPAKEMKELAEL